MRGYEKNQTDIMHLFAMCLSAAMEFQFPAKHDNIFHILRSADLSVAVHYRDAEGA